MHSVVGSVLCYVLHLPYYTYAYIACIRYIRYKCIHRYSCYSCECYAYYDVYTTSCHMCTTRGLGYHHVLPPALCVPYTTGYTARAIPWNRSGIPTTCPYGMYHPSTHRQYHSVVTWYTWAELVYRVCAGYDRERTCMFHS